MTYTVAELLAPWGEWQGPMSTTVDRASDTRRWAYYRIGAMMGPTDTGKVHGPRTLDQVWEAHFARCAQRPGQQGNDVTNVWD